MTHNILIFDTETTGLPTKKYINACSEKDVWPDLVSISWDLYNESEFVRRESYIIKPKGWKITEDSIKIHSITEDIANSKGYDLLFVLDKFREDLKDCRIIISHNLNFDKNVLFNAYKWRLDINPLDFWEEDIEMCTMTIAMDEMKLKPKNCTRFTNCYKYPSLDELYQDTFNKKRILPVIHSSDKDVSDLAEICFSRWDF